MGRAWDAAEAVAFDVLSFTAINALQLRGRGGACTPETARRYVDHWRGAGLADYYRIPDGAHWELSPTGGSWPTPLPSGCAANDRFHLDLFLGPDGWRSPLMFLLHGLMSVSDRGYREWACRLNALGWSAAFVHLPYHYGRCPAHCGSGELCISANLLRSVEALRQMVVELRLACRELRTLGVPGFGLWGQSYGGLAAALLTLLEPDLATAWLLEPIADVDWSWWESPATLAIRAQLRARGLTRAMVAPHVRLVCPSLHTPLMDPGRIMLLAGSFDRIAPPGVVRRLHERWPGSHYREYPQGHVGFKLMPASLALGQRLWPELFADARCAG